MKLKAGTLDYQAKLQAFFAQVGPNPGNCMASIQGWYIAKEREFKAKLRASGELEE